jgi:hypothetical protein
MKLLFQKLVWKRHKTIDEQQFITELDKYAEHTFDNGVYIKVNTGQMAHTNFAGPFEMYVHEPNKEGVLIPHLSSNMVNVSMNDLERKTFE